MSVESSRLKFPGRELAVALAALSVFDRRAWLFAMAGFFATLPVLGIPTAIIDNPLFSRMTPTRTQDYLIWAATALLVGLIAGTFAASRGSTQKGLLSGGLLSFLSIGCPICNKLVVALIGLSGALTFFAPLQLYLGLIAVGLLAWTLWIRMQSLAGNCPVSLPASGDRSLSD